MADETGSWMPMYWGDYFGDTMHLTTEEHGAYLLLLGIYWRRAKPLPDDDRWLASVTKMTTKKWKMVRPNIIEFFDILDGHLIHKRVEKEILKSSGRLNSARAAGRAGGLAKSKLTTTTVTKGKEKPSAKRNGEIQKGDPLAIPPSLDRLKEEFETWWQEVPLKVSKGGAKGAEGAYKAARRKADAETLLAGIRAYAQAVDGKEQQFIAHPKTWLNQERWLDEPLENAGKSSGDSEFDKAMASADSVARSWGR